MVRLGYAAEHVVGRMAALAAILALVGAAAAAPGDRTRIVAGAVNLGEKDDANVAAVRRFVDKLSARPGFSAELCRRTADPAQHWLLPPPGVSSDHWLKLVAVRFGHRRDWLTFRLDADKRAVMLACRRASTTNAPAAGTYLHTITPGPEQVSHNAVAELAAASARAAGRTPTRGPTVRIFVAAGKTAGTQPLNPLNDREQAGVEALAMAAAREVGWTPVLGPASQRLNLTVTRQVQAFSLRAVLGGPGGGREIFVRHRLEDNALFDGLVNLFREIRFWHGGVTESMQIEPRGFQLLGYAAHTVFLVRNGALRVIDLRDKRERWTVPKSERLVPAYAARTDGRGRLRLFRYAPSLASIDLAHGSVSPVGGHLAATEPWGFAIEPAGGSDNEGMCMAATQGQDLHVVIDKTTEWSFTAGGFLSCGPVLAEDQILIGSETGDIFCFSRAGGKPIWRTRLDQRPLGSPASDGSVVVVTTVEGDVHAFSRRDGTVLWTFPAGDVLAAPPLMLPDRVLLTVKNRAVHILDLQTGRPRASYTTPSRPIGAIPAPAAGLLIVACRAGEVIFLDPSDLTEVGRTTLHTVLQPHVVAAPAVPCRWQTAATPDEALVEEQPGVLVCDRRGFIYLLPLPAGEDH